MFGASYAGGKHISHIEGHKPPLFPILYHILKFISVSLGTDLSMMRQSSVNSLVCDGSIR